MLDSLLAGVMLFSSFAIRTPNVQPNPDDYEVSIGLSHSNFYINRQWERELGGLYVDDLVWAKLDNGIYFKPEYMNKESQGVKYLKWTGVINGKIGHMDSQVVIVMKMYSVETLRHSLVLV